MLDTEHLQCPCCQTPMHTSYYRLPDVTPHFVHDSRGPDCPTSNMSPEHLAVQALVQTAINRTLPWRGQLEYRGQNWRGDVVATRPDRPEMVSFEVQLSGMRQAEMLDRTQRHLVAGISRVIWLCGREFAWMDEAPFARFSIPPNWSPQQGLDVSYRMLPRKVWDVNKPYFVAEKRLDKFVGAILTKQLLARPETQIATTVKGQETVLPVHSWYFETRDQVNTDFNAAEVARIQAAQRQNRGWLSTILENLTRNN